MPELCAHVAAIIAHYGMLPHPEGGYYTRSYCSAGSIPAHALPAAFAGDRPYASAILYLLPQGAVSRLHRLRQDEVWHFYLGGRLRLAMISPAGVYSEVRLGQNILAGEQVQHCVHAGYWFGAMPAPDAEYSLLGCTVSPAFDFADFEMGSRDTLARLFPHLQESIVEFSLP